MISKKAIVFVQLLWVILIGVVLFACLSVSNTGCYKKLNTAVSIMTYNIQVDSVFTPLWSARRDNVVENIQDHNPDILGLQEAKKHQQQYLFDELEGYDFVICFVCDGVRGGHNPILYRSDIVELLDSGVIKLFFPRLCTWARFKDLRSGKCFYVYNTHFSLIQHARISSVASIYESMLSREYNQEPVVLCGDLNVTEDDVVLCRFRSAGLFDTWRLAHPEMKPVPTIGNRKLDFILTTLGVDILGTSVVVKKFEKRPSDHNPVIALLEISK